VLASRPVSAMAFSKRDEELLGRASSWETSVTDSTPALGREQAEHPGDVPDRIHDRSPCPILCEAPEL